LSNGLWEEVIAPRGFAAWRRDFASGELADAGGFRDVLMVVLEQKRAPR